jgi:glyoxylase-like metal-dependent hydrolase (beta-lactamase superfamily II)
MNKIKRLAAIKYGETFIHEGMAFQGGDTKVKIPISLIVYLIDTGDRKILVDSGCETMPGYDLFNFSSPADTLRKAGVSPDEITDLILTHAHHDDAEATRSFPNVTVHIEEQAYPYAKCFIPDEMNVEIFRESKTVDGCITVKLIGGHSEGSCIVEFVYRDKKYVICGDECYVRTCLEEKIVTGCSCCPEKSLEFVNRYGSGEYVTLLAHDFEILTGQNGVLEL